MMSVKEDPSIEVPTIVPALAAISSPASEKNKHKYRIINLMMMMHDDDDDDFHVHMDE